MLSREQAQALTRVVHLLRPAWNEEGIYAALGQVKERAPFEVALAAIRAAKDDKAKTPGVIPTNGPHWNEEAPKVPTVPKMSRDEWRARTCETCGHLDCPGRDHPFIPLTQASAGRALSPNLARQELAAAKATTCRHGIDRERAKCADCNRTEATTKETSK